MSKSKKTFYKLLAGGAVLLVILGAAIGGMYGKKNHHLKNEEQNRDSIFSAGPVVKAYVTRNASNTKEIVLLGEARPYETATIYAQISGYLKQIMVDKGDRVAAGQVLAYVDNPQIDQQYRTAQADLANKQKILDRDKKLLEKKFVSQEQEELSETNVETAAATLKSLSEQQGYKTLKAPFAGTITNRFVDPGALIQNAIGSQTGSQPIVTVASLDRLRVYVYVEQKDAGFLKNGYPVEVTVNENADVHITGTISRFAGELDPRTRMMLAEIDLDNHKGEIVPGSYVNVHIKAPQNKHDRIQLPSNALVVHKDKTMVAIIDKDTTLRFTPVVIGENNGDSVTILSGLEPGQLIAVEVGERFTEGQKVRVAIDSTNAKAPAADGAKDNTPKDNADKKKNTPAKNSSGKNS